MKTLERERITPERLGEARMDEVQWTGGALRHGRLPPPFEASPRPELDRLEQAAAGFAELVEERVATERAATLDEVLYAAARQLSEALWSCATSVALRYACLYRRVRREDIATLLQIRTAYRMSPDRRRAKPVAAYFEQMDWLLDEENNGEEAAGRGGGFLVTLLGFAENLADPESWQGTCDHDSPAGWRTIAEVSLHMYRSSKPKLEELLRRLCQALAKERVTLADRQYFDSIIYLFPDAEAPSWIEDYRHQFQTQIMLSRLQDELLAYENWRQHAGEIDEGPAKETYDMLEELDDFMEDLGCSDEPILLPFWKVLYDMGIQRLERMHETLSKQEGREEEGEVRQEDLKAGDLEAFLSLDPGECYELRALDDFMEGFEDIAESVKYRSSSEAERAEAVREAKSSITTCLGEIAVCLGDMKRRYARLWARARLAALLRAEAGKVEAEPEPYRFTVKTEQGEDQIEIDMELDDVQRRQLDETADALEFRHENVARADDVTVKVRRKKSLFHGFLWCQGLEMIDIEVVGVEPFSRARVKDPAYLASVLTAVNAATSPWRTRASRSVEELHTEYEVERVAIDRREPEYWGPSGAGALICTLEALVSYSHFLEEQVTEDEAGGLESVNSDPLGSFEIGMIEMEALSRKLDDLLDRDEVSFDDLKAVKPVRQFFVSRFLVDEWEPPEEAAHLIDTLHEVIAQEFKLDRERREAQWSSARERHVREARVARVGELEYEHDKYGRAAMTGSCELLRLEPSSKVNRKAKLLALLNGAFETASNQRQFASMSAMTL